jgi:2-hydroxychromene-2-carboxylate isomerase
MKRIDFFFDLSSPYSYLASTQIGAIAGKHGVELRWRPMVLAAVFKAVGNDMPARVAPKARWMLRDLTRWAAQYGVPFQFTTRFPVNAISAERLVIAADAQGKAGAAAAAAFRAVWVDDLDLGSEAVLRQIAAAAGMEGDALAALQSQAVKDQLRANTDEAIARGAFGAPAIFVVRDDGEELFWGNDRLHFVEAALGK